MDNSEDLRTVDTTHVVDAVITASRALVAVAARSLDAVDGDVTLAQYRTLVVLASRGTIGLHTLAELLGVAPATASRMCERLVTKSLVIRDIPATNRRQVELSLTPEGKRLIQEVTALRRREIEAIIAHIPLELRPTLVTALEHFASAAGEVPEQDWSLGWEHRV